ncbi:hypothetical protein ABD76_16295 [Paenibacillus dendritiformis]|nr:hypothetical protein [Paenibacillus dendritiformis]
MAFGTGLFLRNLQGLFKGSPDFRSSIWLSWLGAHHRTNADAAVLKYQAIIIAINATMAAVMPSPILVPLLIRIPSFFSS